LNEQGMSPDRPSDLGAYVLGNAQPCDLGVVPPRPKRFGFMHSTCPYLAMIPDR
jgi:hypothetical protein